MENMKDIGAERSVLGSCFKHGFESYSDISDILTVNSFTDESNQNIYKVVSEIFENESDAKLDLPTFISKAKNLNINCFDSIDEKKYLRAVSSVDIDKSNVRKLAGKIRKLEISRELKKQLDTASSELEEIKGDESLNTILQIPEKRLFDFTSLLMTGCDGHQKIGEKSREWLDHIVNNPIEQLGIKTGLNKYDEIIGGGLRPGTVNVLAARPKTGKTVLGCNISMNIASRNIPIFYADTEMTIEDHRIRNLSRISGVSAKLIETGKFGANQEYKKLVYDAQDLLENIPYNFLSVAGQPFEETLAAARRWLIKEVGFRANGKAKDCLLVYDYIKLMDPSSLSLMQEYQALGFIMTGLHNFAVKYGVPILIFCQLNRDGINVENSSAAAGSDRIIWLCSNFSIYKWKTIEEIAEEPLTSGKKKYNLKLLPIVSRHGSGMKEDDYINILGEYDIYKITEGPTRKELASSSNFETEVGEDEIEFN